MRTDGFVKLLGPIQLLKDLVSLSFEHEVVRLVPHNLKILNVLTKELLNADMGRAVLQITQLIELVQAALSDASLH